MLKHLLVYGTLKSGQSNHALLEDAQARYVANVRVPGYDLFNLGWYPGIRKNPQNKVGVECELYEFDGSKETLNKADYYEGYIETEENLSLFLRREVKVNDTEAYIYEYGRDPHGRAFKLEDGVW